MARNESIDKSFLKTLIVQLRSKGMSFQEISNKLMEDYNIERSRQAICGMYNRAVSEDKITQNIEETLSIHDILNYSAIGISCDRISEILQSDGVNISTYRIKSIIQSNKVKLDSLVDTLEERTYLMLKKGMTKEYIADSLRYKVELPTKSTMTKFIQRGTIKLLNKSKAETLGKVLKQTQDKELIKVIISLDDDISYRDVVRASKQ